MDDGIYISPLTLRLWWSWLLGVLSCGIPYTLLIVWVVRADNKRKQKETKVNEKQIYAGWLYCNEDEVDELKTLGVTGPMKWSRWQTEVAQALSKDGIVERCLCDGETLQKLADKYDKLWRDNLADYSDIVKYGRYPNVNFSPFSLEEAKEEWGWEPE